MWASVEPIFELGHAELWRNSFSMYEDPVHHVRRGPKTAPPEIETMSLRSPQSQVPLHRKYHIMPCTIADGSRRNSPEIAFPEPAFEPHSMRKMPPLEDLFQLVCSGHNAKRLRGRPHPTIL